MKSDHQTKDKNQPSGTADSTDDTLKKIMKRIRRTKDFPTVSKYLVEINRKLSDITSYASASELANIILKDYALTNKLLKLVNSAFYGFVAGKVTTVSRAVVLLGHDNVRLAAIGLVLFEHLQNKSEIDDLKDAVNSSFWCGLIAKEIASQQIMIDPEEAFICALLHQLGKMLTIYYLTNEYREIKYRITQEKSVEKHAVKQVIGVSYQALGTAMARQWAFPDTICKTMAPIPKELLGRKDGGLDPLSVVVNFCHALRGIIDTIPLEKRDAAIKNLLQQYRYYIIVSAKQLSSIFDSCLEAVYTNADALQFDVENCNFLQRLTGTVDKEGTITSQGGRTQAQGGAPYRMFGSQELNESTLAPHAQDSISIIMDGIQEIASTMMEEHDINDVALMCLEILYRALQNNRVVMFINESQNQVMKARFGYGVDIQRITGKVRFKIKASEDLFNNAIQSGKDLIVDDAHAPELHRLIPDWYRKSLDARAFIFLPVVFKNICVGAFYADHDQPGPLINALEHKYMAMLRNQLVLAIKFSK